ncbi:unnamed protein product [Acanthoscelides obtectus]|uniref:DDE Tnp4 domain-containing protein n=1 Tax=Acanthoscelides obtectus TaxID=200917 RepID=A0A9P0LDE3_ACAOB|nr:unnamed protein product [Acanthoscelides obtectus]CAK1656813.1 Putative nuclease HARBI1 [Acanthoscelides obtectus]
MGKALENGSLHLPPDQFLPGTTQLAPCVILGDEAFPLKRYLMRPFPGSQVDDPANKQFNYRLDFARRIVENTFGILSQKFRIYNRRMQANPENADYIILATFVLHNFIKIYDGFSFTATDPPSSIVNSELQYIPLQGGNATEEAFQVRNVFKNYFLLPQSQLIN